MTHPSLSEVTISGLRLSHPMFLLPSVCQRAGFWAVWHGPQRFPFAYHCRASSSRLELDRATSMEPFEKAAGSTLLMLRGEETHSRGWMTCKSEAAGGLPSPGFWLGGFLDCMASDKQKPGNKTTGVWGWVSGPKALPFGSLLEASVSWVP